ncbi:hypothetical protein [Alkalibacillus aidingensis]|uniref:hypothetical protein n=1 Tax=Alkalibacillus aidingensis TaxID=2747607 RepID=UPI0016604E5C|nr:hypothetical protein [Alkalibacillus aidingensis]
MDPYHDAYESKYKHDRFLNENNGGSGPNWGPSNDDVVSIGTWVIILILTAIPFINFFVFLALAFATQNETLQNYGKASLIIFVFGLFLAIFAGGCVY